MNREEIEKIRIRLVKLTPHSFREIPEVDDVFDQAAMVEGLEKGIQKIINCVEADSFGLSPGDKKALLHTLKALKQKEPG